MLTTGHPPHMRVGRFGHFWPLSIQSLLGQCSPYAAAAHLGSALPNRAFASAPHCPPLLAPPLIVTITIAVAAAATNQFPRCPGALLHCPSALIFIFLPQLPRFLCLYFLEIMYYNLSSIRYKECVTKKKKRLTWRLKMSVPCRPKNKKL